MLNQEEHFENGHWEIQLDLKSDALEEDISQ